MNKTEQLDMAQNNSDIPDLLRRISQKLKMVEMATQTKREMPEVGKNMIREICRKSGDRLPVYMRVDPRMGIGEMSSVVNPDDMSEYAIWANPMFYDEYGDNAIGLLAHEVGHYHYGHQDKRRLFEESLPQHTLDPVFMIPSQFSQVYDLYHQQEFEADDFAAQWYRTEILWCLNKQWPDDLDSKPYDADSMTHPATADRIARLKAGMTQNQKP